MNFGWIRGSVPASQEPGQRLAVELREPRQLDGIEPPLATPAYETGRQCPSVATVAKVLAALNCSAEDFGRYIGPWDCARDGEVRCD
jgi:hypothetical protein